MQKISFVLFISLFALGCDPTEEKQNKNDSGISDTSEISDAGSDVRQDKDTSVRPDLSADMQTDTPQDMTEQDMGLGDGVAVLGERCEPKNRIGIVTVGRSRLISVWASLKDAPNPLVSDPTSSDAQCDFHSFVSLAPCQLCEETEVCNAAGRCLPLPNILTDAAIKISSETDSRTIVTNNGGLSDQVDLQGDTFSMEVSWSGQKIIVPAMQIPSSLDGLEGKLIGTYDSPDGLEFIWDAPAGQSRIFTRIDINHHVNQPTFVECDVDAASEKLDIAGEMLKPLSVSTGLEFQTIEHARFAAAETPQGCVEFRFQTTRYSLF